MLRLAKGAGASGEALVTARAFRAGVIAPLLGSMYLGQTVRGPTVFLLQTGVC